MNHLAQHIESLIFIAERPVTQVEIKTCLEEAFATKLHKTDLEASIQEIKDKYQAEQFPFEVAEISGGYQFLTKGAYHSTIGAYLKLKNKKQLSRSAMETLSIIAYKQPVAKSEIEKIRGVSCDYSVQKLLEKELIDIGGRSEAPGRPLLYVTSDKFMNYFGIKSLKDLPKLKDFKASENEIGSPPSGEESIIPNSSEDKSKEINESENP